MAGPPEYGGVDPRTWPDCAPLLAAVPGKRDPERPDNKHRADDGRFREATLVPSMCDARIDGLDGIGGVSVTVVWVTKRPEDADVLLDGRPGTPPDADEYADNTVRVGGFIVRVWPHEAERAVVKQLRSTVSS
ncbi:hypothetical protein [Nonomuraea sp. LPB2021202275-12-8]|uniref:hypothetical protein n=1 Tax=Nonomuraea sp. LPB2021202275-12-8 TaxID=3120159 RepID=UPI00300D4ABC